MYYVNGNIQREVLYKNGQLHGIAKTYYENKILRSITTFKNNMSNGPYSHYYQNGCIMSVGESINNKMSGELTIYYPCSKKTPYNHGEIQYKINFKNGKALSGVSFDKNRNKSIMTHAHLNVMGF